MHHAAQGLLQIGAGDAAQAAVAEQHGLVGARSHQRVVDADRAELVDDDRGAWPSGVPGSCLSSVVLPAPRKPVITMTGSARAAFALEPAAELAGGG